MATLGELAEPFKIAYDRTVYPCGGGTVRIYLGDRDLNTNPSSAETVTVGITSDTETTPEDVVLTEKTVNSMIFTGTIPTTSGPPVHGDGLLSVSPDDHLTARYTDALDCNGATNVPYSVTAQTDCTGPVISGVQSLNVTGNSADVTWTTDEASTSVVHYGTTPPGGSSASSAALVTAHGVHLTGLAECSTYYFWVESADAAGNVATNNNGGAWYIFHTGKNVNPTYAYAGSPVSIPDNSATGASVTVSVPDVNTIVDVNVKVNVNHTFDGDLTLSLIGPDGTTVLLSNRRGSSGDNFTNTVFDDQATTPIASGTAPFTGSFKPDALLSAFNGKAPAGTWTLKAVDSASTDVGTIVGFELQLSYPPQACGPAIAYLSSTKTDACNGSGSGGGNGVIEPGETVGLVVTAKDNGTAPVTGVSAVLTTSTPGVTVTDGTATFPNMAAGASAPSNPDHFQFAVDPSFPCGNTIDFAIQFTSNEGSWSDAFSYSTGTPGQATNTYSSTDVPKTIADNATVTSNLPVSNSGTVGDVNATVTLTHTWDGDVTLVLIGPSATRVTPVGAPRQLRRQLHGHGLRRRSDDRHRLRHAPLHRELQARLSALGARRRRGGRHLEARGQRRGLRRHRHADRLVADV